MRNGDVYRVIYHIQLAFCLWEVNDTLHDTWLARWSQYGYEREFFVAVAYLPLVIVIAVPPMNHGKSNLRYRHGFEKTTLRVVKINTASALLVSCF